MTPAADIRAAVTAKDAGRLTALLRARLEPEAIPDELKSLKAWVVWEVDKLDPGRGKFAKVPIYPTTRRRRSGTQGSPSDRANLGTFDQALSVFNLDDDIAGVGLAMLPEFGIVALDVDNCFGPDGGLRAGVAELIQGTYSEVSPSGRGIRAFWRGEARDLKNHDDGFELFHSKGFVTVTGAQWDGEGPGAPLPELTPELRETLERLCTPKGGNRERTGAPRRNDGAMVEADPLDIHEGLTEELRIALRAIPADDRDLWVRMGHALKTLPGDMGRDLWLEWSQKSVDKFNEEDAEEKWEGFHPTDTGFKVVFAEAQRWGWVNPWAGRAPQARGAGRGVVLTCLAAVKPQPVDWIIPGWLARGLLHILAGSPGTGKTTVALAIAAGLTSGHAVLGGKPGVKGNVLIWTGEDDIPRTIVPRLRAMYADMARVHAVTGSRGTDGEILPFDPATDMTQLAEAMRVMGGADLLIVDSIVSAVGGNDHKNSEVRRGLQPLVNLGMEFNCAILGISHFTKSTEGKDPVERVTGSLAFGALARIVMAAAKMREDQGGGRVLVLAKSNISPDGGGFRYDIKAAPLPEHPQIIATRVEWGDRLEGTARELLAEVEEQGGRGRRDGARGDAMAFFARLLSDGAEHPAGEMQAAGAAEGFSRATMRRAAEDLGVIRVQRAGGWWWSLPKSPFEEAEEFFEKGADVQADANTLEVSI